MSGDREALSMLIVAPFTGAWIEMNAITEEESIYVVAPFTGAWIEMGGRSTRSTGSRCRTLHGCVD